MRHVLAPNEFPQDLANIWRKFSQDYFPVFSRARVNWEIQRSQKKRPSIIFPRAIKTPFFQTLHFVGKEGILREMES